MIIKLSEEDKRLIASRIKEIREDNKLTLKELGTIILVSDATVSRYETGEVENIPIPRIKLLSEKFGINPAWILGMSEKKHLNGKE